MIMESAELANRFVYHPPVGTGKIMAHQAVREGLADMAQRMNDWLPEGREKALVMTKLEEAMFWANAAIAREV
jgi:hypothetical protein